MSNYHKQPPTPHNRPYSHNRTDRQSSGEAPQVGLLRSAVDRRRPEGFGAVGRRGESEQLVIQS